MSVNRSHLLSKKENSPSRGLALMKPAGLFIFSFLLASLVIVFEREPYMRWHEFVVGEPAPRTLFSPFKLLYENEKDTALLRQEKGRQVPLVFRKHPKALDQAGAKIEILFSVLHQAKEKSGSDTKLDELKLPIMMSYDSIKFLLEKNALEEARKHLETLLERFLNQEVIDDQTKLGLSDLKANEVLVLNQELKSEKLVAVKQIAAIRDVANAAGESLKQELPKDHRMQDAVLEIFNQVLHPNLMFDLKETKVRRAKAEASVPPVQEEIKKDELVVQRGMLITAEAKMRLEVIQKELLKQKVKNTLLAVSLFVFLAYLLMFFYLYFFERRILMSLRYEVLIHGTLLLSLGFCKAFVLWPIFSIYLMPVALAPLLLALLVNPRIGFLSGAVLAVLIAPMTDFNPELMAAAWFASAASIFATLRVRKRIHFLKVGLVIGLTEFLVIFSFQVFQELPFNEVLLLASYGMASGFLITTPVAFLLLPVLEWIFNLTTDVTLLELSDLNHPLLKRMIVEAPGTYHHSLVVSTLAESACESIGANALLARVGAYFHDIGKIARARYFTENQAYQSASRHEKLSPTMSCLLIMNHVKDGLELGRRYKLKDRILQFIPEHQGTGVIYYFYRKALEAAKAGEQVRVEDFRYPGPKPQSKETAVVMLADSTEAASRSLKDPSPESIRQLVRKIINDKFIDGQLDECTLSLRDLHKIQESFIRNLMAIFHTRVTYPTTLEKSEQPNLFAEDQFSKSRVNG